MNCKLTAIKKEPNNQLIQALEECLEAAKIGRLRSLVAIGECIDKTTWLTKEVDCGCNMFQLLGAIDVQKHFILNECNLQFKEF